LKVQDTGGTNDNLEGDNFDGVEDWFNKPQPSLSTRMTGRTDRISQGSGKLAGSTTVDTVVGRRAVTIMANDPIYEVSFPCCILLEGLSDETMPSLTMVMRKKPQSVSLLQHIQLAVLLC
jgi:hypothetical protein